MSLSTGTDSCEDRAAPDMEPHALLLLPHEPHRIAKACGMQAVRSNRVAERIDPAEAPRRVYC